MCKDLDRLHIGGKHRVNGCAKVNRDIEGAIDVQRAAGVVRGPGRVDLERFLYDARNLMLRRGRSIRELEVGSVYGDQSEARGACGFTAGGAVGARVGVRDFRRLVGRHSERCFQLKA